MINHLCAAILVLITFMMNNMTELLCINEN